MERFGFHAGEGGLLFPFNLSKGGFQLSRNFFWSDVQLDVPARPSIHCLYSVYVRVHVTLSDSGNPR